MKKNLTILFFILVFSVLNIPSRVFAQGTAPTTINARILPTVWYSTLSVNDGDSIKIYAGIQNNSGTNFTGTATFYVDDKEISTSPFSSTADSLKDVSADWVANPGDHNVQVKVSTSLPTDQVLVSSSSDKSTISITQKINPITPEIVGTAVLNTASGIVSNVENLANSLADKIDSFKKPVVSASSVSLTDSKNNITKTVSVKQKGSVLSASTGPKVSLTNSDTTSPAGNSPLDFVFNFCLGILSFLVRNWMWSLGGIVVLFFLLKIIF